MIPDSVDCRTLNLNHVAQCPDAYAAGKLDGEMRELDERIAQLEAALAKGVEANPDMGMSKEEVET